jgi:hypothetical protein
MINEPLTVQVVQVIMPTFNIVPFVYVIAPEHVILKFAKSSVPIVIVNNVQLIDDGNVTVFALLTRVILKPAIALLLNVGVLLPKLGVLVSTIVNDKLVYVPVLDNIKLTTFNVVTAGVLLLPVKFNILNQLPVVIVGIAVPDDIDKFGGFPGGGTQLNGLNVFATAVPTFVKVATGI